MMAVGPNQGKSILLEVTADIKMDSKELNVPTLSPLQTILNVTTFHGSQVLVAGDSSGGVYLLNEFGRIKSEI